VQSSSQIVTTNTQCQSTEGKDLSPREPQLNPIPAVTHELLVASERESNKCFFHVLEKYHFTCGHIKPLIKEVHNLKKHLSI